VKHVILFKKIERNTMNKRISLSYLFVCLGAVALSACASAADSAGEPSADSVSQAVSPVSVFMYVRPGTITPVPPLAHLYEDPGRPTPLFTLLSVVDNATSDHGTYSTSADQAVAAITATEWATMSALIADHTHQVRIDITYDDAVSGANKPFIGGPRFSAVPF
jgi:hypothetical protein